MRKMVSVCVVITIFVSSLLLSGCIVSPSTVEAFKSTDEENIKLETQQEQSWNTISQLNGELNKTKNDLVSAQASATNTQVEITTLKAKVSEMEATCSPRQFQSLDELENWLMAQPSFPTSSDAVLWFKHAMAIQELALRDGYLVYPEIVSEDLVTYNVWCYTILIDGSYYWWDPETKDVYYMLDTLHF